MNGNAIANNQKFSAPAVHPALKKHSEMFKNPRIIKVTDRVYVGFGFAVANMIMVEDMKRNMHEIGDRPIKSKT